MKSSLLVLPIAVVAFCSSVYGVESYSPKILRLMDDLTRNCHELRPFPEPLPELGNPRMWEIQEQMRYIERDLAALRKLDKDAEHSSRLFRGKPFNSTLQTALKLIEANRLALKSAPDPKALSAIDDAIFEGRMGIKWVTNPARFNATLSAMSDKYASYEKAKARAVALDPKILEIRMKELEECEENFVKPFLALREKLEEEAELKKSIGEALRHAETVKRRKEAKENADLKSKIAKAHGASRHHDGVASLIELLTIGAMRVDQAKSLLTIVSSSDAFEVVSTSPQHVFYMLRGDLENPIQIAVERSPGDFYGQGAPLQQVYYKVVGVESFKTVSGAETDLVIFKGCPPVPYESLKGDSDDTQITQAP